MIKLNPDFRIYGKPPRISRRLPPFLFGGVYREVGPYNDSKLTSEMSAVLKDVTDSFYQAYGVKSIIKRPKDIEVLCKIYPISAKIDDSCEDYSFDRLVRKMKKRHGPIGPKKIEERYAQMIEEKKDTTTFILRGPEMGTNGFYFMHPLEEDFDPERTGNFLKTLEMLSLKLFDKKYRIQSGIEEVFLRPGLESKVLKVDMEIIPEPLWYAR